MTSAVLVWVLFQCQLIGSKFSGQLVFPVHHYYSSICFWLRFPGLIFAKKRIWRAFFRRFSPN